MLDYPVLSLVGGKWTSFRAFSEQVTDIVLDRLEKPRRVSTRDLPIGGGQGYPKGEEEQMQWLCAASERAGLNPDRMKTCFERYGTRASKVAEFVAAEDDHALRSMPSYSHREILYLVRHEMILHLEDLLRRRSNLMKLGELTPAVAEELAHILQAQLGWTEKEMTQEISQVLDAAGYR